MNKFAILGIASALLVAGASAQTHKPAKKTTAKTTIHCAVLHDSVVNIAEATKKHMYADYKGHRYFFCCNGCPQQFKANPAKFAKSESIALPHKAKK